CKELPKTWFCWLLQNDVVKSTAPRSGQGGVRQKQRVVHDEERVKDGGLASQDDGARKVTELPGNGDPGHWPGQRDPKLPSAWTPLLVAWIAATCRALIPVRQLKICGYRNPLSALSDGRFGASRCAGNTCQKNRSDLTRSAIVGCSPGADLDHAEGA